MLIRVFMFCTLLLVGCVDPAQTCDAQCAVCQDVPADLVIDEINDQSLLVAGRSLYLHAGDATILLRDGKECQPIELAAVRMGDLAGHNAEAIAESYPAQAWPSTIVIERAS
jgi:hypothetical protein